MKIEEIRKMSTTEIDAKIIECKNELFDLRMKQSSGTLTQTHKIHELRKTIARLKTIKNEKENGGN
jgi:large subunit ribosomal protein L29